MNLFRKLALLLRRDRFHRELDEEMTFHRAQAEEQFRAEGMTARDARRAAARQFGNATRLRERSSEVIGFRVETVAQDLRYAVRQLRRNPGFAVTAIVVLALGIAASVAIFGFVDAALIKPLPYANPTRLAMLFESIPLGPRFHLSYPDYLDWKMRNKSFQSLEVFEGSGFILKTPEGVEQVDAARVSAGFFRTLGVVPILGRDFYSGEDAPEKPRTILLTYAAWHKRYGGRSDVLGQVIMLDGNPSTIIGVLPPNFHFAPVEPAEFWATEHADDDCEKNRGCHNLFGVARLKDGVTSAAALADIKAIAEQLAKEYPDTNRDQVGFMLPLAEVIVGDIRPVLQVLLGGACLLLLIASVNVASLLLVRSESRRREIAVRGALGASAGRLVRQFVTEGLLLAAVGCAVGVSAGVETMRSLTKLVPSEILATMPYLQGLGLNFRVAAFAVCICVITGLLFALTPTFRLSLTEVRQGLTEGGRSSAGTLWKRFGVNLVVIEIATAMVLLVAAGLLGKSLYRLLHASSGLEPDHLATLQVGAVGQRYAKDSAVVGLERQILTKAGSLPGVKSAAITNRLPLGDGDGTLSFLVMGRPYHGEHQEVAFRKISSGYFPTLQARILRGRNFRDDEDASKPSVVIINSTMASQYFHGEDPVGRLISSVHDPKSPIEIVGVVNDLQEGQLDAAPRAAMYLPFDQNAQGFFSVVVRTAETEEAILPTLSETIRRVDPGLAIFAATTMGKRLHDSPSAYLHRTSAWMVGWFASTALLLSVVGLYGVVAYSVSQRTREIGVRMALGAQRGSVYRMILKEAGWLTAIGVALGIAGSLGAATLMRKLLYGTQAWDAGTLLTVALALGTFAMLASFLPARRAAGVNPAEALRAE